MAHRRAEPAVQVGQRLPEPLPDPALDVPPHPVGVGGGEFGDEVLRGRGGLDAPAQREAVPQGFRRGIVRLAEQPAELDPRPADVGFEVRQEAGALAHHPLAQAVHERGVVFVVGHGEQAVALVVPGQGLREVGLSGRADGGGERRQGVFWQQALVVAPGAGARLVLGGDPVADPAVVDPAGPGADAQADQHGVGFEIHVASQSVAAAPGGGSG